MKTARFLSGQELPILFRSYVFEVEAEETAQSTESSLAVHIAPGVYITQEDIRKLQLAKGAIAAGIEVLFKEYGCTPCNIDVLTFAGGFGNYIDKASAAAIGLFPQELLDKAKEVEMRQETELFRQLYRRKPGKEHWR